VLAGDVPGQICPPGCMDITGGKSTDGTLIDL
jgi:hypothetical protein